MAEERVLCFNNLATGECFGEVTMATAPEVMRARRELAALANVWASKPIKQRIRVLRKLQQVIIDSVDEITEVINKDNGKSRQDAWIEVMLSVDKLHQYYKRAPNWLAKRSVPRGLYVFRKYYTVPKPYGVVGVIGPWNYPFELVVPAACSALLAGNVVMVKPSEVCPATGVMIEKLFQRVPELAPFVRFLHGDAQVGAAVVDSKPDMLFLTGSTQTGRTVARKAAENLTPFLFELGGKDPMIVLEDADLGAAAKWGVWGAYYNGGQTCIAIERVYVVDDVYDEFVRLAVQETEKYAVGYSPVVDNQYDMGPLSCQRQVGIIEDHLQDALDKGARILCGGHCEGVFMPPTVLVDVDHSMKIMHDETFGPIMPIMKVKDETHAIQLANDSYLGLSASVWSNNLQRAQRVAEQLEVGSVNINDAVSHYPVSLLPFGGIKQSGNARTHGKEEVLQFTQQRSYAVGRPPLPFDVATILRSPGNYGLGKAIMHLAFGVTLEQRLRPVTQLLEGNRSSGAARAAVGAGAVAALTAVVVGLFRSRSH